MQQKPAVVGKIVMACVILHNILRSRVSLNVANYQQDNHQGVVAQDNENPDEGCALRGYKAARLQREYLKQYCIIWGVNANSLLMTLPLRKKKNNLKKQEADPKEDEITNRKKSNPPLKFKHGIGHVP